ncbi:hypothetical protein Tco_1092193 [Tanacetum coccineum]|uniref:Uncharacterized protein n=1 Tax=Tanacetum coccineum TaxID=301880 RepID=A0ABQ5IAI1_9ASTR
MSPGRKGTPFSFFLQSFRSDKWVGYVSSPIYQFSVLRTDQVGRKVACLPSHPLEKLVARKKRRGSEATDLSAQQTYKEDRCLADSPSPIPGLVVTQKYSKKGMEPLESPEVSHLVGEVSMKFYHWRSLGPTVTWEGSAPEPRQTQQKCKSDRSLSGWKRWVGSLPSRSKQDDITTILDFPLLS